LDLNGKLEAYDKHLSLYVCCCSLRIFLQAIFNIDQSGISGTHSFLKSEFTKSGQWNLKMAGQSGASAAGEKRMGQAWEAEGTGALEASKGCETEWEAKNESGAC
jgi:hypothetical protein